MDVQHSAAAVVRCRLDVGCDAAVHEDKDATMGGRVDALGGDRCLHGADWGRCWGDGRADIIDLSDVLSDIASSCFVEVGFWHDGNVYQATFDECDVLRQTASVVSLLVLQVRVGSAMRVDHDDCQALVCPSVQDVGVALPADRVVTVPYLTSAW